MSWPYQSPRVEFVLSGFDNEKYVYAFERSEITSSNGPFAPPEPVEFAKCLKCGTYVDPDRTALLWHGQLHLAVELAKR